MEVKHNRHQEPPEEAEKSTPPKGEGKKSAKQQTPKYQQVKPKGKEIKGMAKKSRVAQMQGGSTQGNGEGIDSEKVKKYTENGMEKIYARKPVMRSGYFEYAGNKSQ